MDEFDDDCNSNGGESWHQKYSNWEQECIQQLETTTDFETQIESEKGGNAHKLWVSFQTAACSIAQLYKDREQHLSLWLPFQNAAGSVTSLYKDCIESQKRFCEMGFQCGQQKRNKEVLAWAKKRKRTIRREDLISFLSGRNPTNSYGHIHHHYHHSHHRTWTSPKPRLSITDTSHSPNRNSGHHSVTLTRLSLSDNLSDTNSASAINSTNNEEPDLDTFREALALSVGLRSSPQHANSNNSRKAPISRINNNNSNLSELNAFITEEYNRHVESRKRASSSSDVIMDSPTHKRSKYT